MSIASSLLLFRGSKVSNFTMIRQIVDRIAGGGQVLFDQLLRGFHVYMSASGRGYQGQLAPRP